ncbi:protein of unknown function DUF2577 [Gottschalkia purinilytica]|uniref:DUF2577 domain-containing protein n=1 Tax=Gottschalkia purinilytica TaxID=1503 RepID=A0A0L0WEY9_GOTPU|nr:DUF2577 family protein [Gottschalkia purinilytica]KNF10053.1 protein of unknown function DUF2577 [Gottschalkia purinilytica]
MKNNPYSTMLGLMRKHGTIDNPPSLTLATVSSSTPLKIKVSGVEIDTSNILIGEHVIKEKPLNTGDTVAIVPSNDRQTFIVLAKVVRA